ncbi:glycerate kinase [Rufibacter roseus]|uniref:Glycerate kinase n=1 Tax=Rufibacter roseus TaxID=1567108 RepID=A0ABW2DJA6_9BACT|nr:glycerate kinase [Rufibacter roseus]
MQIVIAPDSFKGSLSAKEVGLTIQEAFQLELPDANIKVIPMADGGEGTLETLLFATNGEKIATTATGPLGNSMSTCYGILGDKQTAIIETAAVAGITMVPHDRRNPLLTTTYGLGELILEAIERGLRNFIIGLGGSATNDGGLGMLQALGVTFQDASGASVQPIGASLGLITQIDFSTLDPRIKDCTIKVASDVQNPLCGPEGASYVYGPQKGANPEQVELLDQGMQNYANLVERAIKKPLQEIPGAGAAGGLGFAFLSIGASIEPGAKIIATATGLEQFIASADWVITGEGQSDYQTLYGKLPFFIAQLAKKYHKNTILISGSLGKNHERLLEFFASCHSSVPAPIALPEAMANAKQNLSSCSRNVARLLLHTSFKN